MELKRHLDDLLCHLIELCHLLITLIVSLCAVIRFIISFYSNVFDRDDGDNLEDRIGGVNIFRNVFLPALKVLIILSVMGSIPATIAAPLNTSRDSMDTASVHYMDLNPLAGEYAFGYVAQNSAREERRHSTGLVEGRYSYLNPEGNIIEVAYGADANGFRATGSHFPPQDTPEVKEAKIKFLSTFNAEAKRLKLSSTTPDFESNDNETEEILPTPAISVDDTVDLPPEIDDSEIVSAKIQIPQLLVSPKKNKDSVFLNLPARMIDDDEIRPNYLMIPRIFLARGWNWMIAPIHDIRFRHF